MFPSRQNTNEPPRQIEFVVWMLERTIDLMGPGVEYVKSQSSLISIIDVFQCRTIDLLIDYADKAKSPSFATSKAVRHHITSNACD